jgi:parvulin-like peptidyl-prolyl isomerase
MKSNYVVVACFIGLTVFGFAAQLIPGHERAKVAVALAIIILGTAAAIRLIISKQESRP